MRHARFLTPFLILGSLGFLGILSLVPTFGPAIERIRRMPDAPTLPDTVLTSLLLLQPTILLLVAVAIGVRLAEKAGLVSLILRRCRGQGTAHGTAMAGGWGTALGLAVLGGALAAAADLALRRISPLSFAEVPRLDEVTLAGRAAALLYGGITEELLMRFGVMTLLVWLATHLAAGRRSVAVPVGIAGAAVIFAAGHLPALPGMTPPDNVLVLRTLGLNAALALLYGWLYASRSMEHAMVAHGATHVVFWAVTPLLIAIGL